MFEAKDKIPEELLVRRDNLLGYIHEREQLIARIGSGGIETLSSIDNALRVGRVRKRIADHLAPKKEEIRDLNEQIISIWATAYLHELDVRVGKVEQVREFVTLSYLPIEVQQHFEEELKVFRDKHEGSEEFLAAAEKIRQSKGSEVVNNNPSEDRPARQTFREYLNGLPKAQMNNKKQRRGWEERWKKDKDYFGDEALITIFPKDLAHSVNTANIIRILNWLKRISDSVQTRSRFLGFYDANPLSTLSFVGKKSKLLFKLMYSVISEEVELRGEERSSPSIQ